MSQSTPAAAVSGHHIDWGLLKQQMFIFLQFWRPGVQDQGVSFL